MTTEADVDRNRLLDAVEQDLAGVSRAMQRLDGGTYFTCEACNVPLDEDLLANNPTLSRCPNCPTA